ncbi:LOW QUALITY PROTEIN: hypothetical protein ACHAW6_000107, partial [Cyclotella cf. meneghiniana]
MTFQGQLVKLMVMAAPQIYRSECKRGTSPVCEAAEGIVWNAEGFTVNPYNPCVVTKTIQGDQMAICWHVDGTKVSHHRRSEVTKIENKLRIIYGNNSVSRGKKSTNLRRNIYYSEHGNASMPLYTLVIINTFPEAIVVTSVTPAANHLFKTRVEVETRKLPEEQ